MSDHYVCPVCGYPGLDELPWTSGSGSDEICSSCGTHFGYDDYAGGDPARRETVRRELREAWKRAGCPWFAPAEAPPQGWDPQRQLAAFDEEGVPGSSAG